MRQTVMAVLVALATLLLYAYALSSPSAVAQPELIESNPADGEHVVEALEVLTLCFSEPVDSEDSSNWNFSVKMPDGMPMGLRIVFQPDGRCVDLHAGIPKTAPQGTWTVEWLVRSLAGEEASGLIHFEFGEDLSDGVSPSGEEDGGGLLLPVIIAVGVAAVVASAILVLLRRRARSP